MRSVADATRTVRLQRAASSVRPVPPPPTRLVGSPGSDGLPNGEGKAPAARERKYLFARLKYPTSCPIASMTALRCNQVLSELDDTGAPSLVGGCSCQPRC